MWKIDVSFGIGIVIILIVLSIVLWILLWKILYEYILWKKWKNAEQIIEKAKLEAEQKAEKIIEKAEKEAEQIIERSEKQSLWLIEKLEQKQELISQKEEEIKEKLEEIEKIKKEEENKLYNISKLDEHEAKDIVFNNIESEFSNDLNNVVEKIKKDKLEHAKQESNALLAKTIYRVSVENANNFMVETVSLPSEDYKWRIIGREWRNIHFFEQLVWVNISMDDTPEVIKISSFEPEKRFIAKVVLQKLIKDGRINPVYIEKYYNETIIELPEILKDIWKETLLELWIPMMKPEILEYIWRFELRYSYGQNLLWHTKEVAKISELIANELWYDGLLAKKAWLLHDIGKIDVQSGESHAKVGADILRKYNMHEVVINAAESHHFEVEQIHPISWIVAAADAISAWREWVRNNNTDKYVERIKTLENLVLNIEWVKKAYIMQAWREIRAFIDENLVSDLEAQKLNKLIKTKVEENLDYPGIIKIMTIRENKIIDYVG